MNKEEILAKSRAENGKKDPLVMEAELKGNNYSVIIAIILATVMLIAGIFTGHGLNFGFYGIAMCFNIGPYWEKWKALGEKKYLYLAIAYSVLIIVLIATAIYDLAVTNPNIQ